MPKKKKPEQPDVEETDTLRKHTGRFARIVAAISLLGNLIQIGFNFYLADAKFRLERERHDRETFDAARGAHLDVVNLRKEKIEEYLSATTNGLNLLSQTLEDDAFSSRTAIRLRSLSAQLKESRRSAIEAITREEIRYRDTYDPEFVVTSIEYLESILSVEFLDQMLETLRSRYKRMRSAGDMTSFQNLFRFVAEIHGNSVLVVSVSDANVRSNPNTKADVVTAIRSGTICKIVDIRIDGSWVLVETATGDSGWIYRPLVGPSPESEDYEGYLWL